MFCKAVIKGIDGASRMCPCSFEGEPQHRNRFATNAAAEPVMTLRAMDALSGVVDGGHGFDNTQRHFGVLRGLDERNRILGETRATNPGPAWRNSSQCDCRAPGPAPHPELPLLLSRTNRQFHDERYFVARNAIGRIFYESRGTTVYVENWAALR